MGAQEQSRSTNGELAWLHNIHLQAMCFFASLTEVNRSNTNFEIEFKPEKLDSGLHLSCIKYVGLGLTTTIAFIRNKASLGKRPLRSCQNIKIWHLLCGITLWTIWIECNDRVSNQKQWHESKVKHLIWDDLIMYAKVAWERVVNLLRLVHARSNSPQGFWPNLGW
jgi:hypothetical protein